MEERETRTVGNVEKTEYRANEDGKKIGRQSGIGN